MKTKLLAIIVGSGVLACGTQQADQELVDNNKVKVEPFPADEAASLPGVITMLEVDDSGNVVRKESRQLAEQGMSFGDYDAAEMAFTQAQTNSVNEDTSADSYYGYPNTYGNYQSNWNNSRHSSHHNSRHNSFQNQHSGYNVRGCQNGGFNSRQCQNLAYQAWPTYYRPQYQQNQFRNTRPNYSHGYRYPSCNTYQRSLGVGVGRTRFYLNW